MPFSASTRPAPSSALPSGITSARGLPFQTSRRSHTCHLLSGTAALPADCRHFCPYYALSGYLIVSTEVFRKRANYGAVGKNRKFVRSFNHIPFQLRYLGLLLW